MASVEAMEAGAYRLAAETKSGEIICPKGHARNSMRCLDSFKWCEPEEEARSAPASSALKTPLLQKVREDIEFLNQPSAEQAQLKKAWAPLLKDEEKKLKRLYGLLEDTPEDDLARELVSLYLERDLMERGQYPSPDPYIVLIGEPTVPLLTAAAETRPEMREQILILLGNIGSPAALPLVRKSMAGNDLRETLAAQVALRLILKEDAAAELADHMRGSKDPSVIKAALRQLEFLRQPDWCRYFFEAWKAGKLGFSDLFELGDPQECSADTLADGTDLLIGVLKADAGAGEHFWVREFIARIRQPAALKKLLPFLPQVVNERYRAGGIIRNYSKQADLPALSLGFTNEQADGLLRRWVEILGPVEMKEILAVTPGTVPRLFLSDRLARKEGGRLNLAGNIFTFRIEALDEIGTVLASSEYRFKVGEERHIVLPSTSGGFPDHQIDLRMNFDLENFRFHFEPLVIQLRPHGAGLAADVPVEGVYETSLLISLRGEQVPVLWRFTHLK